MKVLHVIPSLSPTQGGPSVALPAMARSLADRRIEVDVVTTDDDGKGRKLNDVAHGVPIQRDGFRVFYFPKQTEFYKVSLPLWRWLRRNASDYDVIHVHTVFSFATLAGSRAAWLAHVPYIIRPLGVLNVWGMQNRRRWVKALSFRCFDKPALDHAAAIHYTSDQEAVEAACLGIKAAPVVLPLGMDLQSFRSLPPRDSQQKKWPQTQGREVILFLSRLDEKKGIPVLLEAFAIVQQQHPASLLMIAGDGDKDLLAQLKQLAAQLGVDKEVIWAGHLAGESKFAALAGATLFVLPSRSENFGIALLEAMAAGLPCVTTPGVALACDAVCLDAVVRVPVDDAAALAKELVRLLQGRELRHDLSTRAREASTHYSQDQMAERLIDLYSRLTSLRLSPLSIYSSYLT